MDLPEHELSIGSASVRVVPDGTALYRKEFVFAGVPDDAVEPYVQGHTTADGLLEVPYRPLLVRLDGKTLLLDAGPGEELAREWGEPVGRTRQFLASVGIEPKDVDLVIISHAHPDHIGGLTLERDGQRRLLFPNARHFIAREEWDYWLSDQAADAFAMMAAVARVQLPILEEAGVVEWLNEETELLPGVRAVPAPGHTPGHCAVSIEAGGARAVYVADAVGTEASFEHPEWNSAVEVAPDLAIQTRRQLLERAVREDAVVAGFHLWRVGRVQATEQVFRFVPLT